MFMISNDFQNQLFKEKFKLQQISSNFSFLTPQNALNTSRSLILEGHKTYHTITCTKFNKVLLVVCATSKSMRNLHGDM